MDIERLTDVQSPFFTTGESDWRRGTPDVPKVCLLSPPILRRFDGEPEHTLPGAAVLRSSCTAAPFTLRRLSPGSRGPFTECSVHRWGPVPNL